MNSDQNNPFAAFFNTDLFNMDRMIEVQRRAAMSTLGSVQSFHGEWRKASEKAVSQARKETESLMGYGFDLAHEWMGIGFDMGARPLSTLKEEWSRAGQAGGEA